MQLPQWVPEGLDVTVPNAARVYDYALGGYHNFDVDRKFKDEAEALWPGLGDYFRANRAFLGRAVEWLAQAGIRQFLDIGSGIPTLGNVHEIAQETAPDARVMYVDIDPVAVSHGQAILRDNPHADAIHGDARRPLDIINHPDVLKLLDFSQPVAVLLIAVMHFISDADDPRRIVAQLVDRMASGSYLAISHATLGSGVVGPQMEQVRQLYDRTPTPGHFRNSDEIAQMLAGLELVEPGIVLLTDWRPDPEDAQEPQQTTGFVAVARKP
jgi:hypothetical protein